MTIVIVGTDDQLNELDYPVPELGDADDGLYEAA